MIRGREVRRMAAILCMITGMTAVPAYAAAPETFGAVPGWNQISGKWYYLMENGAWSTDFIEDENTRLQRTGRCPMRGKPRIRRAARILYTCWIRRNRNSLMI